MSEAAESSKRDRAAVSPINDDVDKRPCLDLDASYTQAFNETTIIESDDPLHSTVIEATSQSCSTMDTGAVKEGLREALSDPAIIQLLTEAVVAPLMAQIKTLRETVAKKDKEIGDLYARVDSLEQYSRRNSVRISGIKVTENESTDNIVKKLSAEIGVAVTDDMIDRSHRVGKADQQDRAILVKFTSHRHKISLMAARKLLKKRTATSLGFSPSRPRSAAEAVSGQADPGHMGLGW